ncbi:PTS sugar transporter subunit IIC [Candidatus Stoquefichus massiliensis]|uniref:PTS sugar transporter subunit IIC n=1 Tax=Candidatus Stoquefichus massiliensis TaxID=1470350 RepID=UPI000485E9D0|nr:PTS transporter subunit EIIC [Candidatus Stoquefichus massiliensis]
MNKISKLLEDKLLPFAIKISTNSYISSLRDGFAATMPAMIIGSFLTLLLNFPVLAVSEFLTNTFGDSWQLYINGIYNATVPLISMLATISITYFLTKKLKGDVISTIVVNTMLYFMFTPQATHLLSEGGESIVVNGSYSTTYLGAKGFFLAILLGLLIPPLLKKLCEVKFLTIQLPDSVPPSVLKSFLVMIPALIILMSAGIIQFILVRYAKVDLFTFIYQVIQTPIREIVGTSFLGGLLSCFFTYIAWFFGLHGGLLMGPINSVVFGELLPANNAAFVAGEAIPHFFTGVPFLEVFTKMGGGGNVLALIVAILFVAKSSEYREVAKIGLVPSLFNISEPMVFGLPIVFNPILIIPFLIAPLVCYSIAYFAAAVGSIAPIVVQVPWTIPIGINMFLSTAGDIMSVVWQLGLFVLSVIIYIPFIRINEKANMKMSENRVGGENA